jgi:hypothetical protein
MNPFCNRFFGAFFVMPWSPPSSLSEGMMSPLFFCGGVPLEEAWDLGLGGAMQSSESNSDDSAPVD